VIKREWRPFKVNGGDNSAIRVACFSITLLQRLSQLYLMAQTQMGLHEAACLHARLIGIASVPRSSGRRDAEFVGARRPAGGLSAALLRDQRQDGVRGPRQARPGHGALCRRCALQRPLAALCVTHVYCQTLPFVEVIPSTIRDCPSHPVGLPSQGEH